MYAYVNEGGAKLFVLDVSDPTAPRLAGTPSLPGWVGYLEPVGDCRVLGVGPFPDRNAQVGVSSFDSSDPADLRILDTL